MGTPDPEGEWVTLRNMMDRAVQLRDWRLRDSQAETPLPLIELPPRGVALITAHAAAPPPALPHEVRVTLDGRIGNGLRNEGDSLALLDADGAVVDALSWGDDRSVLDPPLARVASGTPLSRSSSTSSGSPPGLTSGNNSAPRPISAAPGGLAVATTTAFPTPGANETQTPTSASIASIPAAPADVRMIVISEIDPRAGWVELYNRGSVAVELRSWSLSKSNGVATMMLGSVHTIQPYSFLVVQAPGLRLSEPGQSLLLRGPGGAVADLVATGPVDGENGWSRYPVHGGAWTKNTPLTRGGFNLPSVEISAERLNDVDPPEISAEVTVAGTSGTSVLQWWHFALPPVIFALLVAWALLANRRVVEDEDVSPPNGA